MNTTTAFVFLCLLMTGQPDAVSKEEKAARELLEVADRAYQEHQIEQAFNFWTKIETDYPQTDSRSLATLSIGKALKEQKKYQEAIQKFSELLQVSVVDSQPSRCLMQTHANYHSQAQWNIGLCRFEQGQYEKAIEAFRAVMEDQPFQSWCGTCQSQYQCQYALYMGLCYEHLNDYRLAIRQYYRVFEPGLLAENPQIFLRIADLYEAAGQKEQLMKIMDQSDERLLRLLEEEHGKPLSRQDQKQIHQVAPSSIIRTVYRLRDGEKEGRYKELIETMKDANGDITSYRTRLKYYKQIEAARLLALHPVQTVPLLKTAMINHEDKRIFYYALGLCGSSEAIAALQEQLQKTQNTHWLRSILYALTLAGPQGDVVIESWFRTVQSESSHDYLRRLYSSDDLGETSKEIRFRTIPPDISLPSRLAELSDQVAFEESIPHDFEPDFSSPKAVTQSLFTAALMQDAELYQQCLTADSKLKRVFEDISTGLRKRKLLNIEVINEMQVESDRVQVHVSFLRDGKPYIVVFVAVQKESRWLLSSIECECSEDEYKRMGSLCE